MYVDNNDNINYSNIIINIIIIINIHQIWALK